jgi:branched-chain amino acid transport system ATP-binding protein
MSLLQLAGVSKRFGQVVVAEDISLEIGPGDAVGIVGPNGAGKTSLFAMVSGDIHPDAGEISFDGVNLARLSPDDRARAGLGRTYQVPRPFEAMTVFENALLAAQQGGRLKGRKSHAQAYRVLEQTGLASYANRPAGSLSLLMRKRLELARALASGPRVVLLDEIAGGLTDLEVNDLTVIVRQLRCDGIAVVWIEHVVRALISTVDRLVCLAAGVIVADGEPRQVLASEAVRAVYMGGKVFDEVQRQ